MSSLRLNLLTMLLFLTLAFFQYRLWFEPNGILDMLKIKKQLAAQMASNDKLKKHNEDLLFQIQRLHDSQDEIESRARNELGMTKKDETFYQVVK